MSEKRPRIGILYLGSRGGICYYTCELARALAAHADVTVYVSKHNAILAQYQALPATVRVFETYSGMVELLSSVVLQSGPKAVARAIDADAQEVLLDTGAGPWAEIVKSHLKSRPLLADVIHDVSLHPDRWQVLVRLQYWAYPKRSDVYIALTRYSFDQLPQAYPGARYVESRLGIINRPGRVASPEQVRDQRKRLIFFGRIEAYKGLDVLVEAFSIAKAIDPELTLTVAGQGPIAPALAARMSELGVRLINDWLDDATIDELLTSHGLMVLPYRSATQSGVVATAWSYGLPCVGTRVGGLQEQIAEGETGLLVPPEDASALAEALVRLAGDPERVMAMSQEARRQAETTFGWETIAKKLVDDLGALR